MQFAFIEGNITNKGISMKQLSNGNSLCSFVVSVPEGFGKYKRTDYITCVAYGKTAENINKFFKPHSLIQIKGKFNNDPYRKDESGKYDVPNWQLKVDEFMFPPKNTGDADEEEDEEDNSTVSYPSNSTDGFVPIDDGDEDIPF